MTNPVINIEHLSKRYILRHQQQTRYVSLRDVIMERTKGLLKGDKSGFKKQEEFLALRDISFQVNRGDRIGIIGRNGAGKSTLLKILSRIVTPTMGRVTIEGRVASLLEVGTGFHPELTGRENIFLNGSILGMNRNEIRQKFDEIISFAEVERFLDTPVKRYSSGMYVRLAFAVAAHLEPDILIVDEVLAVGDAQFQRKCLGKMDDISRNFGRTVLFVSHNMGAIASLCTRAVVLNNGSMTFCGHIDAGISHYLQSSKRQDATLSERTDRKGNGSFLFTTAGFYNKDYQPIAETFSGDEVIIRIGYLVQEQIDYSQLLISLALVDDAGNMVASFISDEMGVDFSYLAERNQFELRIPELMLRPNMYSLRLFASILGTSDEDVCDVIENVASITIMPADYWDSGKPLRNGNYSLMKGKYLK